MIFELFRVFIMFSKKKSPPIQTLIGEGTVFKGEICFAGGLRIDGEVIGDVIAANTDRNILVISEKARVMGKVKAGHIIVSGEVTGPIHSDELLELQPKAHVVGDVQYEALEMHRGATIDGELKPLKAIEKPSLKLAASNAA